MSTEIYSETQVPLLPVLVEPEVIKSKLSEEQFKSLKRYRAWLDSLIESPGQRVINGQELNYLYGYRHPNLADREGEGGVVAQIYPVSEVLYLLAAGAALNDDPKSKFIAEGAINIMNYFQNAGETNYHFVDKPDRDYAVYNHIGTNPYVEDTVRFYNYPFKKRAKLDWYKNDPKKPELWPAQTEFGHFQTEFWVKIGREGSEGLLLMQMEAQSIGSAYTPKGELLLYGRNFFDEVYGRNKINLAVARGSLAECNGMMSAIVGHMRSPSLRRGQI